MRNYSKQLYLSLQLTRLSEERRHEVQELHAAAIALVKEGRLKNAAALYETMLTMQASNAEWWRELCTLRLQLQQPEAALVAILRSLALKPNSAESHWSFGRLLKRSVDRQRALESYETTLDLPFDIWPAYASAGRNIDVFEALVVPYDQNEALCVQPASDAHDMGSLYSSLGHAYLALGRLPQAVQAYESACQLLSNDPFALRNLAFALQLTGERERANLLLGNAYFEEERYGKAVLQFEQALGATIADVGIYEKLAYSHNSIRQHLAAIETCKLAANRFSLTKDIFREWVWALLELGRLSDARSIAKQASDYLADSLFLAHARLLSLPRIYDTSSQVEKERQRFIAGLHDFRRLIDTVGPIDQAQAVKLLGANFYLAYQGKNDLELQQAYGSLIHRLMKEAFSTQRPDRSPISPCDRIRVGYISSFIQWHTVAKLFYGWLADRDPDRFETFVYHTGSDVHLLTHEFEHACDHFHHVEDDCTKIIKQLVDDRLHVLIFLDIGMDSTIEQIAGLRLAPIQCVAWGHPVTTGLPTIDHFISSQLMEPEGAQSHYSENLVQLPGIGVNVPAPYIPESPRGHGEFGLSEVDTLYLSSQSLFKYLPKYDHVFPAIASRVPNSRFVFIEPIAEQTLAFRNRLVREFKRFDLDVADRIVILPRQGYWSYLELNRLCDVYLDTIGWSGGMTSLEALGCKLPIVTCPGAYMRGRHSYAMLMQMGIHDTIAKNVDEYVEISVKLGLDPKWRNHLSRQIGDRHDRLFNDVRCVRALEEFLYRATTERLGVAFGDCGTETVGTMSP